MVPLNDLKRQYDELAVEIDVAVRDVLTSGWYVLGPQHDAFEREFAAANGARYCVGVGNGTDALEIGLAALDCGPGAEVVTVANAGFYTSTAVRKLGAVPIYVDVDPERLLVQPEAVAAAITSRTKAVVVTHLYGQLGPVEQVVELAADRGVPVLEDCAQAVGARRNGRAAGTFGAIGTFSFYPTKNLGAVGDGGALLTDDEELATRTRSLRQYGWSGKYEVDRTGGRNSRLDELQAAVLRVKLPHVTAWNARRRQVVACYRTALSQSTSARLVNSGLEDDVAHLCVLLAQERDAVAAHLAEQGVATAVHYPVPDHLQPLLGGRAATAGILGVTERTALQILTLPCFAELTDDEVEQVSRALAAL